mmetsp:Transcript_8046/g.15818  ORF Transcript_8046/g.15818 Transcript_8046/m.15818 type:complete len:294 (-) Transcript_8046:229-1110(-)
MRRAVSAPENHAKGSSGRNRSGPPKRLPPKHAMTKRKGKVRISGKIIPTMTFLPSQVDLESSKKKSRLDDIPTGFERVPRSKSKAEHPNETKTISSSPNSSKSCPRNARPDPKKIKSTKPNQTEQNPAKTNTTESNPTKLNSAIETVAPEDEDREGNIRTTPEAGHDDAMFQEDFAPPMFRQISGDSGKESSEAHETSKGMSELDEKFLDIRQESSPDRSETPPSLGEKSVKIEDECPYLNITEVSDGDIPHGLFQLYDAGVFCTDEGEILCNFRTGKWYKILGLKGHVINHS